MEKITCADMCVLERTLGNVTIHKHRGRKGRWNARYFNNEDNFKRQLTYKEYEHGYAKPIVHINCKTVEMDIDETDFWICTFSSESIHLALYGIGIGYKDNARLDSARWHTYAIEDKKINYYGINLSRDLKTKLIFDIMELL